MKYSFKDNINYFSEQLKTTPPQEEIEKGAIELSLDTVSVSLHEEKEGGMSMTLELGMLSSPEKRSTQLSAANFLGAGTAGCTFYMDPNLDILMLKVSNDATTPPQENWEWVQRIWAAGQHWAQNCAEWEEYTPLSTFPPPEPLQTPTTGNIRA